eukprot:5078845-Lingulodinium_polyedra.AAC.1
MKGLLSCTDEPPVSIDFEAPPAQAGAEKIVFSAPARGMHFVAWEHQDTYDPSLTCVSPAYCTTYGLAPA